MFYIMEKGASSFFHNHIVFLGILSCKCGEKINWGKVAILQYYVE